MHIGKVDNRKIFPADDLSRHARRGGGLYKVNSQNGKLVHACRCEHQLILGNKPASSSAIKVVYPNERGYVRADPWNRQIMPRSRYSSYIRWPLYIVTFFKSAILNFSLCVAFLIWPRHLHMSRLSCLLHLFVIDRKYSRSLASQP